MFWKIILAILAALVAMRLWDGYGWTAVIVVIGGVLVIFLVLGMWGWWLDRYYDEWLRVPDGGDYNVWLARRE